MVSQHVLGEATEPVSVSTAVSESEWDAYVDGHPDGTSDHASQWQGIFREVFGHESSYLAARRGNTIVGVLPLVRFESRLFGRFISSLPFLNYGGVLADDAVTGDALVSAAEQVARDFGASHVELRHTARQFATLPVRQHKLQLTRPLPATSEALWTGLDKKVRNLVRKGQKEGLTVETGGSDLAAPFYDVFARNMRDLGTPVYSKDLFSETLRRFPDRARAHIIRFQRVPIAASITLRHKTTVMVPWASSLRSYRQQAPNMLLYWSMLEQAVIDGARTFDFGRSSPGSGTHAFKVQWGATEQPLHWEYVLLTRQQAPDQGPTNPKFQAVVEVWKRLPLWLTNLAGPHIVRNIP